jgi:hypothetical protein
VATVVPMHGLKIALPPAQLDALAREDIVQRVSALGQPRTVNNDGIRSKVGVQHLGASTALPELDGTGVMVAQWDEFWVSLRHMGFWETFFGPPRVIWPGECFDPTGDVCTSQHATHVAGTILSNELVAPGRYRGMAPNAHMISFQWWVGPSSFLWGHDKAILENNADISANSWGLDPVAVGEVGDYLEPSAWIDAAVRGGIFYNKPLLTSWSAGNSRDPRIPSSFFCDDAVRLYGCINEPGATAKNVITVGATDSNYEGRPVAFSSVGPTDDGRLKPDVMAPGTEDRPWLPVFDELLITSAEHPDSYWQTLGTSMAQPVVAGSAALLIQQYRDKHVANPLPSTIKALLIHTARDIGRHGPDYEYGYGRINTEMASQLITQNLVREGNIIVQDNVIHKITVPDNAEELRVTLVWSDFPAAPSLAKDLMNDLDLILMKPAPLEIHEPWVLDPTDPEALATRGVNRRDNVEQVVVDRPRSGEWVINVSAFRVPMRPQNYSLVISGKIAHSHRHIYDVIAIKESEEFEPDIDGRIVRFRAFGGGVQVGSSGSRYDVSTDCASHTEIMVKDTFGGTTLACLDSGEVYAVPDVTKSYHLAGAAIQPRDPSRDAPDGYPNVIAVMKAEQPKFQGIILGGGGVGLPGPNCPGGGPGGRCP